MALIGLDFASFPMGSLWSSYTQDERDRWIRLMLSRLDKYGITDERDYTDVELGAISVYIRTLVEQDGRGDIEPPAFTTESLSAVRDVVPPPFALPGPPVTQTSPSGGGASVDRAQVEAIIDEEVAPWAEEGNEDQIPLSKLPELPDGGITTTLAYNQVPGLGSTDSFFIRLGATQGDQSVGIPEDEWWLVRLSLPSGNATDISPYYQWVRTADIRAVDAVDPTTQPVPMPSNSVALSFTENRYTNTEATVNAETLYFGRTDVNELLVAHSVTGPASIAGYRLTIESVSRSTSGGSPSPSPSPSGVDRSQVESIIRQEVYDWAEEGNTDQIPLDKLGNVPSGGGSGDGGIDSDQIEAFAKVASTGQDQIITVDALTSQPSDYPAGQPFPPSDPPTNPVAFLLGNSYNENSNLRVKINNKWIAASSLSEAVPGWALEGNSDQIPSNKLGNAPALAGMGGSGFIGRGESIQFTTATLTNNQISTMVDVRVVVDQDEIVDNDLLFFVIAADNFNTERVEHAVSGKKWRSLADISLTNNAAVNVPTSSLIGEQLPGDLAPTLWLGRDEDGNVYAAVTNAILTATEWTLAVWKTVDGGGTGLNEEQVDARITTLVENWAEANTDFTIPRSKLPSTIQLATELPSASNESFGNLYGIGPDESDGSDPRIEPSSLAYYKHRDESVTNLYTGRLLGQLEVYGYSDRTVANAYEAGGALLPGGVAPEMVEEFVHGRIANTAPYISVIANTSPESPFEALDEFKWQWKRQSETTWTDGTNLVRDTSYSEMNRRRYTLVGSAGGDLFLPTNEVIDVRYLDNMDQVIDLFSTDRYVNVVDEDRLEAFRAQSVNLLSQSLSPIRSQLANAGGGIGNGTLIGTWERNTSNTSSTSLTGSGVTALTGGSRTSLKKWRLSDIEVGFGDQIKWPRDVDVRPSTNDLNGRRFVQVNNFDFNFFRLLYSDLSDNRRGEVYHALEFNPLLGNHEPFEDVFVRLELDSIGSIVTLTALVDVLDRRLKIYGYKI